MLLNPSKADERVHDPTSRRCVGYAFRWGYERVEIGNLFAWCATDPRALLSIDDPIGPWGDQVLTELAQAADRIVVGWGAVGQASYRARQVERILRLGRTPLFALRVGAKGAPAHPLYVSAAVEPVVWPGRER